LSLATQIHSQAPLQSETQFCMPHLKFWIGGRTIGCLVVRLFSTGKCRFEGDEGVHVLRSNFESLGEIRDVVSSRILTRSGEKRKSLLTFVSQYFTYWLCLLLKLLGSENMVVWLEICEVDWLVRREMELHDMLKIGEVYW